MPMRGVQQCAAALVNGWASAFGVELGEGHHRLVDPAELHQAHEPSDVWLER